MGEIFISYRRRDSQYAADRLCSIIESYFENPKESVFLDIEGMQPGRDFVSQIDKRVSNCNRMFVVIGPDWLAELEQRRSDPEDFVRIEIERALAREIDVVPILLEGTPMPAASSLPEGIEMLSTRHAIAVNRVSFDSDVHRLMTKLGYKVFRPKKSSFVSAKAAVAGCVLLGAVGAGLFWINSNPAGISFNIQGDTKSTNDAPGVVEANIVETAQNGDQANHDTSVVESAELPVAQERPSAAANDDMEPRENPVLKRALENGSIRDFRLALEEPLKSDELESVRTVVAKYDQAVDEFEAALIKAWLVTEETNLPRGLDELKSDDRFAALVSGVNLEAADSSSIEQATRAIRDGEHCLQNDQKANAQIANLSTAAWHNRSRGDLLDDLIPSLVMCSFDAGEPEAELLVGMAFHLGEFGAEKSELVARDHYSNACEKGVTRACYELGSLMSRADDFVRDDTQAYEAFSRACEADHARGCERAGSALLRGRGVAVDIDSGLTLMDKSCDLGRVDACYSLAMIYADTELFESVDVPFNSRKMLDYLEVTCTKRYASACRDLAHIYRYGMDFEDGRKVAADPLLTSQYREACAAASGGYYSSC